MVGVDATEEDGSLGCLINHLKSFKHIKAVLKAEQGKPIIKFISLRQITKDEKLLYDYSDWSQVSKKKISMANELKSNRRENEFLI